MQTTVAIVDQQLAASPHETFSLFGNGRQAGWLLDVECDVVRPGAIVSLRLPGDELGQQLGNGVHLLGRIAKYVPAQLIEIVHDQPWPGRLRLHFKPSPTGGTHLRVSAQLDERGLAWLMDRRGWAPHTAVDDSVHRIGLLTSKSGPGAVFAVACEYLAGLSVEEINAEGGLNGKPVELLVHDDATDSARAELEAARLVATGCQAIIASVTSASFEGAQRAVRRTGTPLIYPLVNEGGHADSHVLRWGERPLDQVSAAAGRIMRDTDSRQWYLIGNDYSWSHGAHIAAAQAIGGAGGQLVGSRFTPLGTTDFGRVIDDIRRSNASLIVSSLVGADEVAFEREAWSSGLRRHCEVLALSMEESTRERVGDDASAGIWTAFGYYETFDGEINKDLRQRYRHTYGHWAPPISSLSESVYEAILLYAGAVRASHGKGYADVVRRLHQVRAVMPRGTVATAGPTSMAQKLRVARAIPGGFRLADG